jgi:hypothetical protein
MIIIVWMDIAESCGKDRWYGILYIIPIANWIMMYILGSGEAIPPQQQPPLSQPPQQGSQPPNTTPPAQ